MQSHSQDLRDRVLWALNWENVQRRLPAGWKSVKCGFTGYGSGGRRRANAAVCRSADIVVDVAAAEKESVLRAWIEQEPGLSLTELCERLAGKGVAIQVGALWHQSNKWKLTFKKNAARQRSRRGACARLRVLTCERPCR